VIAHAAALNTPLRARFAGVGADANHDAAHSVVTCNRPGLIIDTIKPAIDGRGLIVRLYEGHDTRGPANLTFAHPVAWAEECTLLEDRLDAQVQASGRTISLDVLPYGLRTLRVGLQER
jgi:alpha-mannosidase